MILKKELCIHLTDPALIAKIDSICDGGKAVKYKDFASEVFTEYFNNRIVQLKSMGIDKLAEYAYSLEKKRKESKDESKED